MTHAERTALLDCRNMLNHLLILPTQTAFDKQNIMKRIDAADAVLFNGGYGDDDKPGYVGMN